MWVRNPPDTIVAELDPVVVTIWPQDGGFTADISSDAPGRDPVGTTKGSEKVHELGAITPFVFKGMDGTTGIPQVTRVLNIVSDPAEDVLR